MLFNNKTKILVTGSNGRFAKVLKKKNKTLNLFFADKKKCNILDLKSIELIIKKVKPEIILHCAGLSRPMDIHEKDICKSIDLNIIGTANIVKVSKKYNLKIIYFSTNYVYEGTIGNYKETDPVKPFNNYGLSKLGGECSISMYVNSLILRIAMTEKPFLYTKAFANLKSNFLFQEDLVLMLPQLINKKGIINIGGKIQSIYNFAKKYNPNMQKIKAPKNVKLPLNQSMNVGKLNKIIKA